MKAEYVNFQSSVHNQLVNICGIVSTFNHIHHDYKQGLRWALLMCFLWTQQGLQQATEGESTPTDPDKTEDLPAAGDVKKTHPSQISGNPAGGNLECGPVTVE